jgi:4-hydroxy-3-methylbut-2-enyl diphosphate reductase
VTTTTGKVLLAAPRGYCAGVDRAVVTVEKALDVHGAPVYVRKQIVHNKHVVETLEQRGVIFVDELSEVPEGSLVVFSAHGVSPAVHAEAKERNLKTIGTMGEAPDNMVLVDGLDQVAKLEVKEGEKIAWLSQTTLSVDETLETVHALKKKLPILMDPPSDDICYATQNRQAAVKNIAPKVDVLIVVGSSNSSNSVRLVDVALEAGVKKSFRVDSESELKKEWFEGAKSVGLTSGASVPEELVDGVLAWLNTNGFGDVEEVETIEEHITFSLPVEIRKDLKAAGKN